MCIGFVWALAWWKFVKEKPNGHGDCEEIKGQEIVSESIEVSEEKPKYKIKTSFYLKQKNNII